MLEKRLLDAEEVAMFLGVSKPYAYKIMRKLNEELEQSGHMTIAGKVSRDYLNEKFCTGGTRREEGEYARV